MDYKFTQYRDENRKLVTAIECTPYNEIVDKLNDLKIDVSNLLAEAKEEQKRLQEIEDEADRQAAAKHYSDDATLDVLNDAMDKTMAFDAFVDVLEYIQGKLEGEN